MKATIPAVIEVTQYGARPDSGEDATLAVFRALQQCREMEAAVLRFAPGRYDFWPELAYEKEVVISNHDNDGRRKIAFPLIGMKQLSIEAPQAEFVFHGLIIPFLLDNSSNIRLSGFSIDWEVPMMAQGSITEVFEEGFEIRVDEGYAYELTDGKLSFQGEGWSREVWGLIEYDPATQATAYGSADQWSWGHYKELQVTEPEPGVLRFSGNRTRRKPILGNKLIFRFGRRDHPAIVVSGCTDTVIEEVTVRHALGMGVIAQNSRDTRLNRFHVTGREDTERVFTTMADATHFVYCTGLIELKDCLLEHQMDDPCNVHGIYGRIARRVTPDTLLVQLMNRQQKGVNIASPGERMGFVSGQSLLTYGAAELTSVHPINMDYMLLTFKDELSETLQPGDAVENISRTAKVVIQGCTVRRNRARGFLITAAGEVLLEGNTISSPGAGVKISGDANFWFESGGTQSIVIRGNTFLDCNYAYPSWGKAVIDIDPEIQDPESAGGYYHGRIRIEDNVFRTYDKPLVKGHSVAQLAFTGNRIERSATYPPHGGAEHALELKACGTVELEGNTTTENQTASLLIGGRPISWKVEERLVIEANHN
ncbi:right-handed parallel beta-helix repeat-containing protein [Paenibacillus sp. GD4]|uniref:right-handed parallel beta-helix repeat-containing protein n=1 Tax=Paenibacillus sp. GD4 TaxID=3068890 RepID=UPI0027968356|nr:right-handed parallel beta-helix repeat-containing protein [Paenibacillus sp. GD4]MDQ1910525.1 right-handed parallel beta-helix repeat-containing protein [Paenibacillus sp. GD4]